MPRHRATRPDRGRLGRALAAIRAAGPRGVSNLELVIQAGITDPKDAVYELRYLGIKIRSVRCTSSTGKHHVRYVLEEASEEVA